MLLTWVMGLSSGPGRKQGKPQRIYISLQLPCSFAAKVIVPPLFHQTPADWQSLAVGADACKKPQRAREWFKCYMYDCVTVTFPVNEQLCNRFPKFCTLMPFYTLFVQSASNVIIQVESSSGFRALLTTNQAGHIKNMYLDFFFFY